MPQSVVDFRSNPQENILHAARVIGRSEARRKVFEAIYRGKKAWKSVQEIADATGLSRMRVLQEGGRLRGNEVVRQTRMDGDTAYAKDPVLGQHKKKIMEVAGKPDKQAKIPTKQNPRGTVLHKFVTTRGSPTPTQITVDDIRSFERVRKVARPNPKLKVNRIRESVIKAGFKSILGETQPFKDWGGENNDLFTYKLQIGAKRCSAAFAFKGRATQGPLTPRKMGVNGDQIGRLFSVHAAAYIIVYHGKVTESVYEQMRAFAVARSMSGHKVTYGVIDGDDLNRLCQAYSRDFR